MLEVGTGFHPELTGRENIFLNGAILGMHRHEIKAKFDEIVAFAEVEKFLDTPVKRYSAECMCGSPLQSPRIWSQKFSSLMKCSPSAMPSSRKNAWIKWKPLLRGTDCTVLFVSHNMNAVRSLCSTATLLENGQIIDRGTVGDVIASYLKGGETATSVVTWNEPKSAPGDDFIRLMAVRVTCDDLPIVRVDLSREIVVTLDYVVLKTHPNVILACTLTMRVRAHSLGRRHGISTI